MPRLVAPPSLLLLLLLGDDADNLLGDPMVLGMWAWF
jgi:hypothetical protein